MGSSSNAPAGYQPTGQAAADNSFQNLQGQLTGAATNLASTAPSQYSSIYNSTANNPYYTTAQTGANQASQLGSQWVAPTQIGAAANETLAGNQAGAAASAADNSLSAILANYGTSPGLVGRAQQDAGQLYAAIPAATAGYNLAQPNYDQMTGAASSLAGLDLSGLSMIPGMTSAAQTVLNTGMDPQQALYDRNYQQTMEAQNASSAQNGVSGSPFAAGLAGQTAGNFNIDWNAQQLQNQINALSAYTNTMGTAGTMANNFINGAASNYGSLMNDATTNFNNLTNSATSNLNTLDTSADTMLQSAKQQQWADQQASMTNAINNYSSMSGVMNSDLSQQASDYANASDLGAAGLNTMTTSAMYPNQVYMNQQNQILQALNAMVSGDTASLAPLQSAIGNDATYLQLGQSATQNAQNAQSINNQASADLLSGIGGLAGLAMAPFTGGMTL